ncbi:hypothetical protein CTI12_AA018720 [Artemisia annua]|uniref:Uncharacterized protein n=1 Tax=Artemisia annua TaxID=35608 RepID=A0A2U1QKM8_ARTAN|nr:hypothetical protein CTI12_AA018720 [Artemisia annua]
MSRSDVNVVLLRKRESYSVPRPSVVALCFSMMIYVILPCLDILDVFKLLVGVGVSVFLLTQWLVDFKCFLHYTKLVGSLTEEVYFDFQKQRFIYSHEKGTFYKLPYPTSETFGYYLNSTGYDTDSQVQIAADKWGRNVIEYPQTTFRELVKEHCMKPFFLFEVFCNGLCCLGGPRFINSGLFGLFVLFLVESLAVISQLKTLADIRRVRVAIDSRVLMVYCNGKWTRVAGTDLVPGDVVSIGRFVCQDTETEESIPADMLILEGSLIVSESISQLKVSIKDRRPEEHLSYKRDKRHVLFRGTRILHHEPDMKFHIKAPDSGCIAFVLRTGFKTNQGKVVRTSLFSREKVTAKSWERGLFTLLLVFSAIIAVAHLFKKGLENPNRSTHKLFLSYTLSITSVIPPELPITLSMAKCSLKRISMCNQLTTIYNQLDALVKINSRSYFMANIRSDKSFRIVFAVSLGFWLLCDYRARVQRADLVLAFWGIRTRMSTELELCTYMDKFALGFCIRIMRTFRNILVVESRTQLISELGELDTFWEDFTCLDVSQCMLNKTILQVASNYLESDISKCLSQLLALGTKGSIWCRKHMKMTLMSTDDSQEEEHYGLFFQVLLDMLSHSAVVLSVLARHPVSTGKELMSAVETFILELLNLTKDSILEAKLFRGAIGFLCGIDCNLKRIQTRGSEILKASQVILDAVICLCKAYCNNTKSDDNGRTEKDVQSSVKESDDVNHVISVVKCTVEYLVELGILAANAGGNLVTVLNLSWKGVVTLLQLGKGLLSDKLNISDIILSLISLAKGALSCAAQTWSSLIEPVSAAEAKRIFIPVKFYLINAARIISHYPSQAFSIFKDITLCILTVLTFRIFLGKDELLKSASDTLAELLEPTSVHLLNSLLNSAQLGHKHKCQILDWLFSDITTSSFVPKDDKSMDAIFSLTCASMHESKLLLLGHVALFVNLLRSAPDLEDDVKLVIAKKLEWLLNILIDEDVYSSIIALPLPLLHGSGNQNMFSSVIHAMKTFMLVASSTLVWGEVESFLLENFFHPHHLCWEIIMELWCFLVRHAESDMGNAIIDQLCTLMKTTVSCESVMDSGSVLRKLARSISMLVKCGSHSMTDRVFNFVTNSNVSKLSSAMYVALLMEGFPLNGLSDKVRSVAKQRLLTEYFNFVDVFDNDSSRERANVIFGAPVFALSAALQSLQVSMSDTEMKTIKLLSTIINKYNTSSDNSKDQYRKLLSETLGIISSMKHLYTSEEMGRVILQLQSLFISKSAVTDSGLSKCKPNLAAFVTGLGHIQFEETNNNNSKVSASWELFHMLLKERHWALAHLSMTAFGYFSARTSCNELWRFVPPDAALSFDLESGVDVNDERFMSEFKVFFEKEVANVKTTPGSNELALLVKEGLLLKQMAHKMMTIDSDAMEIDDTAQTNKKRKFPDGIGEGVSLLQNGLRVIASTLGLWQQNQLDYSDIHGEFLTRFSNLEDAVGQMAATISQTM